MVAVLPDVTALRRRFDYTVPGPLDERVIVGTQVRVPLHGRRVAGWVVADAVQPPPGVALRPLAAVRGWGPPPAILDLALWAAWRWAGAEAQLLRTASAATAVRSLPPPPPQPAPPSTLLPPPLSPPSLSPSRPESGRSGVGPVAGAEVGECVVLRLPPGRDPGPAVEEVARMGLARPGAGSLVLAPGRRQVDAVATRLRAAGLPVAVLPDEWAAARRGGCVVAGTRAAAFAPIADLGAAVVIDAHDQAYHQEQAPTWSAWQVAVERARRSGAPCLLVSACPTLEVLGAGRLVTLSRSDERAGWPRIEVVDRRRDDPRTGLFSSRVVDVVRWATAAPERRVVCIVNRTGRVRILACATCRELARCERCQGPLELVDAPDTGEPESSDPAGQAGGPADRFRCRRCGSERPVVCAACGSTRFKALRVGVKRVREELAALAGAPVVELSATPGSRAADPSEPAGDSDRRAPLVVGTEAALHRLTWADVVVFLDFDDELLAPRLRAAEEAMALLARAARLVARPRAGPESGSGRAPGRVLVQTRQPGHEVLHAAVLADPGRLAASELAVRRSLGLPPVTAMARVSGAVADAYGEALRLAAEGTAVSVSGPLQGVWLVRAPDHVALCDLLAAVPRPPGRLRVEVDPVRP